MTFMFTKGENSGESILVNYHEEGPLNYDVMEKFYQKLKQLNIISGIIILSFIFNIFLFR